MSKIIRIDEGDFLAGKPHNPRIDLEEFERELTERGGAGSGYRAPHYGRPGERGGSLPREGGSGGGDVGGGMAKFGETTFPARTPEEAAENYHAIHAQLEPQVTNYLTQVSQRFGAEMVGMDNRLKKPSSLARKVKADAESMGIPPSEAVTMINDAIRYTMVTDADSLVDTVLAIQKDMAANGWVKYDEKWKNFFHPGDAYDGYNTVFWNPETGIKFELQFHTQESINLKSEAHKMYEEYRNLPEDSPKRRELFEQMTAIWQNYNRPSGYERLPGIQMGIAH